MFVYLLHKMPDSVQQVWGFSRGPGGFRELQEALREACPPILVLSARVHQFWPTILLGILFYRLRFYSLQRPFGKPATRP